MSVPEAIKINKEPQHVLDAYGPECQVSKFAANCLLARGWLNEVFDLSNCIIAPISMEGC